MDIKATVENAVKKITGDKALLEKFKTDPESAVESVIGKDLPDGTIDKVVNAVKAKLSADTVSGIAGKLTGLFKKK